MYNLRQIRMNEGKVQVRIDKDTVVMIPVQERDKENLEALLKYDAAFLLGHNEKRIFNISSRNAYQIHRDIYIEMPGTVRLTLTAKWHNFVGQLRSSDYNRSFLVNCN